MYPSSTTTVLPPFMCATLVYKVVVQIPRSQVPSAARNGWLAGLADSEGGPDQVGQQRTPQGVFCCTPCLALPLYV